VVPLDRTVESLGDRADLDLFRRRFATDGPLFITGSPGSTSPNAPLLVDAAPVRKTRNKMLGGLGMGAHPLAQTAASSSLFAGGGAYKKWTVWRKQPMTFMPQHERVLAIDGEDLHIMPAATGTGKAFLNDTQGKTTTIHFSHVVGCKVTRKHPSNFKVSEPWCCFVCMPVYVCVCAYVCILIMR
jgi:hypothetical protein